MQIFGRTIVPAIVYTPNYGYEYWPRVIAYPIYLWLFGFLDTYSGFQVLWESQPLMTNQVTRKLKPTGGIKVDHASANRVRSIPITQYAERFKLTWGFLWQELQHDLESKARYATYELASTTVNMHVRLAELLQAAVVLPCILDFLSSHI